MKELPAADQAAPGMDACDLTAEQRAEGLARRRDDVGQARDVGHADPWVSGIARLQEMAPLVGFSPARWQLVRLGCASLLEDWGSEMRRLGWSVEDGFGVHPEVPGAAVRCYGLGVLLNGGHVVEMTDMAARIELRSGVHQTFTRMPVVYAVPIWTVWQSA